MSNSPLPPTRRGFPTKVVIEGVEPGSAASQRLLHQLTGVVSHFQSKARQQQQLGEVEVLSMHQAFPGGGGMRYNYNNGQETITVALTTVEREFLLASRLEDYTPPFDPLLAIDVVITPRTYEVGSIYSHTLIKSEDPPPVPTPDDSFGRDNGDPQLMAESNYRPFFHVQASRDMTFGGTFVNTYVTEADLRQLAGQSAPDAGGYTTTATFLQLAVNNPSESFPGQRYDPETSGKTIWYLKQFQSTHHVGPPPAGGAQPDPDKDWTKQVITTLPEIEAYFRTEAATTSGRVTAFYVIEEGRWDGTPEYSTTTPMGKIAGNGPGRVHLGDAPPYTTNSATDWVYVGVEDRVDNPDGTYNAGAAGFVFVLNEFIKPSNVRQLNMRESTTGFDIVDVVGLLVDHPKDKDRYSALSTADTTDPRLRSLAHEGAKETVTRSLTIDGDIAPVMGAGFVAKPRKYITPGQQGVEPTVIDVYIASDNMAKSNSFAGTEEARFDTDSADMTYSYAQPVAFRVQVREFVESAPRVALVTGGTEERVEKFQATGYGSDLQPVISQGVVTLQGGRLIDWKTAVDKDWVDPGGDPTTALEHNGKLLATTDETTCTVTGPPGEPRENYTIPVWDADVAAMTLVARITWNPPTKAHEHGTATIVVMCSRQAG